MLIKVENMNVGKQTSPEIDSNEESKKTGRKQCEDYLSVENARNKRRSPSSAMESCCSFIPER